MKFHQLTFVIFVTILLTECSTLPTISSQQNITKFAKTVRSRNNCNPPAVSFRGMILNMTEIKLEHSSTAEVKFPGIIGPAKDKLICKLKCIDGKWVGPLCSSTADGRFQPLFRDCTMLLDQPRLLLTFRNETFKSGSRFAHGAMLHARCRNFGLFKLVGDNTIKCRNGVWVNAPPTCVPTSKITNFTEDAPPSILVDITVGSASVEPSGDLFVYPESFLHLNCIVSKNKGVPEWSWTTKYGHRKIEWSEEVMESEIHYRLKLDRVQSSDSGIYSCSTGVATNSVSIQVVSVNCKSLTIKDKHLTHYSDGNNLGQSIRFSCPNGFTLSGSPNITCLGSGLWSNAAPSCEVVRCGFLSRIGDHIHLAEVDQAAGGRAVFSCEWGYKLVGYPGIECGDDGKWSGPPPLCEAIRCPPPLIPINGYQIGVSRLPADKRYYVGDLVQYSCSESFVARGEASIVCTESGFWSHPPPFCVSSDYEMALTEDYIHLIEVPLLNKTSHWNMDIGDKK